MLNTQRIKEAEVNVRTYLSDGLLRKTTMTKDVLNILLRNAKESLRMAEEAHQKNISDLWTIVCSYYAMYYYANAVLLKLGYKVGDNLLCVIRLCLCHYIQDILHRDRFQKFINLAIFKPLFHLQHV